MTVISRQYAEGKGLGLSEEEVRRNMAVDRGVGLRHLTSELLQQAMREQSKGQRATLRPGPLLH